ncbi:MAG: methyltransferase domain-containing protein [Bacteroidetes bacterium]|mgnify:CR=1 FL=1|nr:methyltransferase domain-containing protein [Bacteroidota bacterium]
MKDNPLNEIRNKQKASWNAFSSGWRKWRTQLNQHMQPATDGIIHLLNPVGEQIILDIASGTGEPGFSISSFIPHGRVVMTDLSEEMLNIAREYALLKNNTRLTFKNCDVCALPFADNRFDSISCRMGFMFFPDMQIAANEMMRVLKPGGKLATSVWSTPDKNQWVTDLGDVIKTRLQMPDPKPGAPGIFRCCQPELMTQILQKAGLQHASVKEVDTSLEYKSAETYWEMMTEIAAPVTAALRETDDQMYKLIKQEVINLVNSKYPGDKKVMKGSILLVYGEKPFA